MSALAEPQPVSLPKASTMTLEEFRALPEDENVERMLIRGQLWEAPMTKRTRKHGRLESRIAHLLWKWADTQPSPRPEVYSGEIGCEFPKLKTSVGVDVALVSAELESKLSDTDKYIVGAPTLVVEILSPSDQAEHIHTKIDDYLAAGVPLVWIVEPFHETITVHRPDAHPEMFAGDQLLSADPILPGFTIALSDVFSR